MVFFPSFFFFLVRPFGITALVCSESYVVAWVYPTKRVAPPPVLVVSTRRRVASALPVFLTFFFVRVTHLALALIQRRSERTGEVTAPSCVALVFGRCRCGSGTR